MNDRCFVAFDRGSAWRRVCVATAGVAVLLGARVADAQPACTSQWTAAHTNGTVHAMLLMPDGDVIVGGEFTMAGGVAANEIARWNPATDTWSAMGQGFYGGPVLALARLNTGELIAGGAFAFNNGQGGLIARWDPSSSAWVSLGETLNGRVWALLAMPDGELIVGGDFDHAGTELARGLARWNPVTSTWTGPGIEDRFASVRTLSLHPDGDVIVGGGFTFVSGGAAVNHIARWNKATNLFTSLGPPPGLDRWCFVGSAAALGDGDIVAAGVIATANPFTGYHTIGRFHPATGTWSAFSGTGGNMFGLLVLPDGKLIVGGDTATPIGYPTYIARWDPVTSAWSSVDSRLNGWVHAVVRLPSGEILVGGEFVSGGDNDADHLARLTLSAQAPPGIIAAPASASVCGTGSNKFEAPATGVGTVSHVWQIQTAPGVWESFGADPIPLPCGGTARATAIDAFTDHPTIAIRPCGGGAPQHYQIRVVISDDFCTTTSAEATYSVCPADFNCTGYVSVQDIFDFLAAYFGGDARADVSDDGEIGVQDIFEFLAAYFAGCG